MAYTERNVGVGVLDDPSAARRHCTMRDVEDAVPYDCS